MSKFWWFIALFLRYTVGYITFWQLDIVCSPLIFKVKDNLFHFWFTKTTMWNAYAFFFWFMALGYFIPEIVYILRGLYRHR